MNYGLSPVKDNEIPVDSLIQGDSLGKRYTYKLFTNVTGIFFNFFIQIIIPRGLGPKLYGDFNFLNNFFIQVVNFFDMGTSSCFYTKLSQRQNDFSLVAFYFQFTALVSLMVIGIVIAAHLADFGGQLWPEQEAIYVYLASVLGIITWISQVLNKMADAYGITVPAEKARMLQKLLGLFLILLLFVTHQLKLAQYFLYNLIIIAMLIVSLVWIIKNKIQFPREVWKISWKEVTAYSKEFYRYCNPLFVYAPVGLIAGIFDYWLLQRFGGSIQQGFYGFSYQIGVICILFTSAMTPLLMRELSIAFGNKDLTQMAYLFRRYFPLLYAIAAFLSCFIAMQAGKIIYIVGGTKFNGALIPVIVMAFYPIHQTYGQLSTSVLYATGQTGLLRNVGIIFMVLGLPVTYFLLAPQKKLGLDAGAIGLAIKMVLIQLIAVNVQLYFNTRLLNLRFWHYVAHQFVSVGCLLFYAAISTMVIDKYLALHDKVVISLLLAGILYSLLVIISTYLQPVLFGLKREDITYLIRMGKEKCGIL